MKIAAVIMFVLLVFAAPAAAHNSNCHKTKKCSAAAVDPSFACDGTTCTLTVTGLAATTDYQASIHFVGADGHGCNTGISSQTSDDTGALAFTAPESFVKCGLGEGGTVTAWARAGDSASFNDPPVVLSDGTLATVTVTIS